MAKLKHRIQLHENRVASHLSSAEREQLIGLLERSGVEVNLAADLDKQAADEAPLGAGLRVAGS